MNNVEAKLILHACRSGGRDLGDPRMREALEQVRRDLTRRTVRLSSSA